MRSRARWIVGLGLLGGLTALFPACASAQKSVSVNALGALEPSVQEDMYVIGVGDLLNVQVWDQDKMSAHVRVRADGRVSLPFLDDVEAAGETPVRLARELETGLKSVVVIPKVTVIVEESRPLSVSVLGEVAKPGLQTLERGSGVAQALAVSGGLTAFAHKNRIFVLRPGVQPDRIQFTYEDITGAHGRARLFRLRTGDVVVVE